MTVRSLLFGMAVSALVVVAHASEVILTSEGLNETLKQMQRIRQGMENAAPAVRADGLYELGVLATELANVLSEEVALYDSQQGGLVQLALDRTGELGLKISWVQEKERFLYDAAAFKEYLQLSPDGQHAGESAYQVLEAEFVQLAADDPSSLLQAAEHKQDYLKQYPDHERSPEVALILAIDYRDLWRLYRSAADEENEARYRELTRNQFLNVSKNYPDVRQAKIAAGLQTRFETEVQQALENTAAPGTQ